jgi:hypothetical protein
MKPKVVFLCYNNPASDPILNRINTIQTLAPYFLKIRFNIILPSTPSSLDFVVYSRFPSKNLYFLSAPLHAPCSAIFDFTTVIIGDWIFSILLQSLSVS